MGGSLGLGLACFVIGLVALVFFPCGGVLLLFVGLVLVLLFLVGIGRRATGKSP